MKKKLLAVTAAALSAVFAFALAACDDGETTGGSGTHTHTYSEQWSHNDTDHWHACTGADCDEVTDKAAHTWDNGNITKEPTCTAKGEKTYTCTVCSATKTEEIATTEHTFSDKWESDETYHWHKCINCDEISGKAEHTYTDGVCVCGHIKPNTDPMPEFDPIDTLDELYNTPKPDEKDFTEEKYGANYALFYENAVKEYNAAQDMQKAIFDGLNKYLVPKIINRFSDSNSFSIKVNKWYLKTQNMQSDIVDYIEVEFNYTSDNDLYTYYYMTIYARKNYILDLENLANPTQEFFDTAFMVKNLADMPKFITNEFFKYKLSQKEWLKDLLTAITTKFETKLDGNVQSFIYTDGTSTGDIEIGGFLQQFLIFNISDYGYEKYSIYILGGADDWIQSLNEGKYRYHEGETGTFSGQYLDENSGNDTIELPAAELIAAPAEYKGYAAN